MLNARKQRRGIGFIQLLVLLPLFLFRSGADYASRYRPGDAYDDDDDDIAQRLLYRELYDSSSSPRLEDEYPRRVEVAYDVDNNREYAQSYDDRMDTRAENQVEELVEDIRRSDDGRPASFKRAYTASLPRPMSEKPPLWLPIVVIGSVASVMVVVAVSAATFYYRRSKRRREEFANEFIPAIAEERSLGRGGIGLLSGLASDGDRKLAHSAQMYHYQHQKQQMIAMEKHSDQTTTTSHHSSLLSDADSEGADECGDDEEGDFTVYECPGMASTGQLEVSNPLFDSNLIDQPVVPGPSGSVSSPDKSNATEGDQNSSLLGLRSSEEEVADKKKRSIDRASEL